jgi:hypothetical protein
MTIKDLYQKYQIMPQLQRHMLRVAGVGKIIAEHWRDKCDVKLITELCLLHDMGNIVKFDLSTEAVKTKMFGVPTDLEYWRKIQNEYRQKFGQDAHSATKGILAEAKLERFNKFIDEEHKLYFAEARERELSKVSLEAIILMYSDCRVTPSGVVSYRERIDDLSARYGGVGTPTWYDWTYGFEDWMQSKVKIDLNSITEASVTPLFDELLTHTL